MSQKLPSSTRSAGTTVFILAIFLSAFLLFQVQPIIARYILPWYGGSPSVWSACMLFFQLGLVVGYGYAHFLVSTLRDRHPLQIGIHFALVVLAVITLPISPDPSLKPVTDTTLPILAIIKLLAQTVGIPYVILSASGPLIQHWFSRVFPARSPFRLYAVSNLGSLLALLSYPFLFEIYLTVSQQSILWSFGFVAYTAVLCAAAYAFYKSREQAPASQVESVFQISTKPVTSPRPTHFLRWILFSACGSVLLLAITNQICQDVAVVPFLWVLPLSFYLLSFIIAFDHSRWYFRPIVIPATAISIGLVIIILNKEFDSINWPILWQITIFCSALFFSCLACHGEIVRLKPAPRFLTHFYLAISVGGALGGIFVNLVAPNVFDYYFELHIGILLLTILMTWQVLPEIFKIRPSSNPNQRFIGRLALVGGGGILWCASLVYIVIGLHTHTQKEGEEVITSSRSFFGVLKVKETRALTGETYRTLVHGQIHHGTQFIDPQMKRTPTTYYTYRSGIGSIFEFIPQRYNRSQYEPLHVGVIGLGVGTVATYAIPEDRFRFYEINQQVIDLAHSHFTYLKDCPGTVDVILGDARISLEQELAQGQGNKFDILVIDAFSGDSIPMHLLTVEAFDLYLSHLKEDGVLAFHITNRHIDLGDPLRNLAGRLRWQSMRLGSHPNNGIGAPAEWVIITRNRPLIDTFTAARRIYLWERKTPKNILWTDDFSNLFRVLK